MTLHSRLERVWDLHFEKFVLVCYWVLGLCNNFAYVIMLSAAHDILEPPNKNSTGLDDDFMFGNSSNRYDCNDLSTGTILLADILPTIFIKMTAPFFVHRIKYSARVVCIVIVNAASFLLVALVPPHIKWLIFFGVACASFSAGFGEITFLSLSTLYNRKYSITGWGSGTGAAGLLGSLGYAVLTQIGLTPKTTILCMLFIPVLMALSYAVLPTTEFANERVYVSFTDDAEASQDEVDEDSGSKQRQQTTTNEQLVGAQVQVEAEVDSSETSVFIHRLSLLRPLIKFMVPLFIVYYAEYFINQGLFELLYFKNAFIKNHKDQYRWYNVIYQLTVFISRSSIRWIQISFLPIFPILQLINVAIVLSQIFGDYMPSIWLAFVLIFWEGLLGGACYVNAFNQISIEVPKKNREFSIAIASIADSFGIALAGFTAIPAHNAICDFGNK